MTSIFSQRLQEALNKQNMTQAELARITNIPTSAVNSYVKGKYSAKQDKVYLIAKALNVSEAWLMGFDTEKQPQNNINEQFKKIIKDYLITVDNNNSSDYATSFIDITNNILDRYEAKEGTPEELMKELHERINQLIHTK